MPKSYIIVAALKAETPNLEQFAPIIHTGVGKLNAAITLQSNPRIPARACN